MDKAKEEGGICIAFDGLLHIGSVSCIVAILLGNY